MIHVILFTIGTALTNAVVSSAVDAKLTADFIQYIAEFDRGYEMGTVEFEQRQAIFSRRVELIAEHNARPDRRWDAGSNELTDRTDDELANLRGWRHVKRTNHNLALLEESVHVEKTLAQKVDWRRLAMSADVPNQGGCGSCWAVAAASMMQARCEVKNRSRTFSVQQLVNCVPNPKECGGSGGCNGATVELAMQYVDMMGAESVENEPYHGRDMTCTHPVKSTSFLEPRVRSHREPGKSNGVGLKSWHKLPENQAKPLMAAVAAGPVAISVGASLRWDFYSQGVFDGCEKDAVINHAVVLFGYGQEKGTKYWLIRNSWGKSWGEQGFMRLLRHSSPEEDDAYCGTDHDPSAGLACKPYPRSVTVCGMCGMLYDSVEAHFEF